MTIILIRYNKVTNQSFVNLMRKQTDRMTIHWIDIPPMGDLNYSYISFSLAKLPFHFDAVVVGDVFWQTGQNICKWCSEQNVRCYFLQHGQWVYIKNKMDPEYVPTATLFFGSDVADMVSQWPYGQRSRVAVTGSPRYDNAVLDPIGDYVYFCPPIIREITPGAPVKHHQENLDAIKQLSGVDKLVRLKIHPHYREGDISPLMNIFPNAEFHDPNEDPLPLIARAGKVLTHRNSTTILDAIAHGKISVLMNNDQWDPSFFERGYFGDFAIENDSVASCFDSLESDMQLFIDEDYDERASPYIYLGEASLRATQEFFY